MDNICQRLREEVAWEPEVGELMGQAAREIERLRLTDAEREAVDMAIDLLNGVEDVSAGASSRADAAAATLRGLLERMGGGR